MEPLNNDLLTVVQTTSPCNKRVYFGPDGKIAKEPAQPISEAVARTVPVPDLAALEAVLNQIGRDPTATLVLGFVPGTEDGSPYHLVSKRVMAQRLRIKEDDLPSGLQTINGQYFATRTKDTFAPSTWTLFDYDPAPDMPEELRTAEPELWRDWMCELLPALSSCGHIITRSTSGRVMVDDAPAFQLSGWHAFVQVTDANDVERFGRDLLIHALSTRFGFLRPICSREDGEIVGSRPWSIFDPSTFSRERLVYDGAPTVSGEGLHVVEPRLRVTPGERLDTSELIITPETRVAVAERTGLRVERSGVSGRLNGTNILVNDTALTLETRITTKRGEMSVADYWRSPEEKLRAQAVFRPDSTSWAAFLSRHQDGTPFLYDIGLQTKYVLGASQVNHFKEQRALEWVQQSAVETVKAEWVEHARGLNPVGTHSLLNAVRLKTGSPLQPLKSQLKAAESRWEQERVAALAKDREQDLLEEGRLFIRWSADQLPEIVARVGQRLVEHQGPAQVFCYSGRLVTVKTGVPATVRQIQRKHHEGDQYPEQLIIQEYTDATCRLRVQESVAFGTERGLIGCPLSVSKVLQDDPSFAPPLSGLQEAPTVTPDGHFLGTSGYDARTGLYCSFDASLIEDLPREATRDDAEEALRYLLETFFADFPFKDELDFTAAVALLLTAFVRRFLIKAPGFLVSATVQASGKSALIELVFRSAFGRPASASSWSDDQAEMAKHLLAILKEGHSGVCFDNLPFGHRVDGDELAKVITQEQYSNRLLGENTTSAFPTSVLICITGNQLLPVNDMATRLLPIYLEPDCENPENREFSRPDIERWVDEHRADVVRAVYTILLAWHQRGDEEEPNITPTRFPEWDEAVRKPLVWLGLPDLLPKFQESKNDNEIEIANAKIVQMLHERFGDTWFELKDVLAEPSGVGDAHPRGGVPPGVLPNSWSRNFRELLPDNSPLDSRRLANRFRFFEGRVYDGLKLEKESRTNKSRKSLRWRVVSVHNGGTETSADAEDAVVVTPDAA